MANQTDGDWEQILIHDVNPEGSGLLWANQQFYRHRLAPRGRYVFILDDDDWLTDRNFVGTLKEIAFWENQPDVIMFRWDHLGHGILPYLDSQWKRRPVGGLVGASCFVVLLEPWRRFIRCFGYPREGDFHFLRALWDAGCRFHWHLGVMGRIGKTRGSWGAPEETA